MQPAHGRKRDLTLRRRPLRTSADERTRALGGREPVAALAAAAGALPTVERWAAELETLDGTERAAVLDRASHVLEHRFDLLGSGPTDLGADIDWLQDFKSGRRWPLDHGSRIVISYPDQSDIKVPWELSRCQHLPLPAAAYRMTEEPRFIDEVGAQLISWIHANPVEFGVNWACTMDVAIRGANWVAALALAGPVLSSVSWIDEVIGSLLLHSRFIRSHLESGSARGNHYLADVVGLLVISAVFCGSDEGRGWALWGTHELGLEMRHQVRADGCDHEASTAYHRR